MFWKGLVEDKDRTRIEVFGLFVLRIFFKKVILYKNPSQLGFLFPEIS